MLNDNERRRDGLIAHGASIVPLMRGFGGSFGHLVGYHIESGAKGGANMAELNMMAKHMHAHVDMSGSGLVRRMKPHSNGALIVHVYVGGARIAKTKVLEEHAQVESFFGGFGTGDVFAFFRAEKCSAAELDLPGACSAVQEEDVTTGALVAIGICAPIRVREAVKH